MRWVSPRTETRLIDLITGAACGLLLAILFAGALGWL